MKWSRSSQGWVNLRLIPCPVKWTLSHFDVSLCPNLQSSKLVYWSWSRIRRFYQNHNFTTFHLMMNSSSLSFESFLSQISSLLLSQISSLLSQISSSNPFTQFLSPHSPSWNEWMKMWQKLARRNSTEWNNKQSILWGLNVKEKYSLIQVLKWGRKYRKRERESE